MSFLDKMSLIRILYVDDDAGSEYQKVRFEHAYENVQFDHCRTNKAALDALQSRTYDIIMYDVGMDRFDSYPIAEKFKDLKPGAILIGMSLMIECHSLPSFFDGKIDTLYACIHGLEEVLEPFCFSFVKRRTLGKSAGD